MSKRPTISDLWVSAVDEKPRDFSFDGDGYGTHWTDVIPDFDEWDIAECRAWLKHQGYEIEADADDDQTRDKCREVATDDQKFAPMMNSIYPLSDMTDSDAARLQKAVIPTACVVVLIDDDGDGEPETPYLALAGGGMDLSWDICEAYMLCGYLPPVHFCELPQYAGKKLDTRARWIIAGCKRSCSVLRGWCGRKLERLRDVRRAMQSK